MIRCAAPLAALALAATAAAHEPARCEMELVVLGAGQDAGAPQIGNAQDKGPRLLPSALGIIDREGGKRYLFDATPAITEQLAMLDAVEPPRDGLGIDGIFLTHAHLGHYLGLAWLGREAAGAKGVPVFAMPRMAQFLRSNGPWSQLVSLGNIEIAELADGELMPVTDSFGVWPIAVPHRDEFSETVGYLIMTPGKTALYVPDLDSWEEFAVRGDTSLAELVASVDLAFIDATFWDDNELPGRDMSEIPHPRVSGTMDLLESLPAEERWKIHFIHYNHTNPVRDPASAESAEVAARGFRIARGGERSCLD